MKITCHLACFINEKKVLFLFGPAHFFEMLAPLIRIERSKKNKVNAKKKQ